MPSSPIRATQCPVSLHDAHREVLEQLTRPGRQVDLVEINQISRLTDRRCRSHPAMQRTGLPHRARLSSP